LTAAPGCRRKSSSHAGFADSVKLFQNASPAALTVENSVEKLKDDQDNAPVLTEPLSHACRAAKSSRIAAQHTYYI